MVEEGEQGPVDEEGAVLELRKRVVVELAGSQQIFTIWGDSRLLCTFCSIRSLTLVTSSIAASQFVCRISQASFPQVAWEVLSPSVDYHGHQHSAHDPQAEN